MYLPLDGTVSDITGNASSSYEKNTWTADRWGNVNSAAMFSGGAAGAGDIIELSGSTFVNASTTFSVWFKVNSADYAAGSKIMFGLATERGYFMEVGGDLAWTKLATSHMISPDPNTHYFGTAWTLSLIHI